MKKNKKVLPPLIITMIVVVALSISIYFFINNDFLLLVLYGKDKGNNSIDNFLVDKEENKKNLLTISHKDIVKYDKTIFNVFFHSLIIYPEKAAKDIYNIDGYRNNMLTVSQFNQVLKQLYNNNFILIDISLVYYLDENGKMYQKELYLPEGKKPLIISVDDLNYYSYMKDGGFARRLIVENNTIKTEVINPEGNKIIMDGDVVPIIESFIKEHPDFSFNGARGIIGITGFEGILGYRTQLKSRKGDVEREDVKIVVEELKGCGWKFASHSYGHDMDFYQGTIDSNFLEKDILSWKKEVESLIGSTNIYIGPYGEIFEVGDPRRDQLINAGFNIFYGVGMGDFKNFYENYLVMDRANIDSYRLKNNTKRLYETYGISIEENF